MNPPSYRRHLISPWWVASGGVIALAVLFVLLNLSSPTPDVSVRDVNRTATTVPANVVKATPRGVTSSWVMAENAKPGSPGWNITGQQVAGSIQGYADHVSAQRGDTVTLYVSTVAPSFHVEAYRMGWYGGNLGRLVWTSDTIPGMVQAACAITPSTNMVECHWKPSLSIRIGSAWPPGDYLLKLVGSGDQQYRLPLTVRDDSSTAAYVIQNSVTTWQAYNLWGGYDLYQGRSRGGSTFDNRSRVVSFDRPYDFSFGGGAADFIGNELPLVNMAEKLGLDVTYWTDIDLSERPQLLQQHRALISLGHDEYWSSSMRQGVSNALGHGVNLAFLGANAMYRHIRLEASPLGPDRHVICYKLATEDPMYGQNNAEVTANWPDPPIPRPESEIIGDMYDCNPVEAAMVFTDPGSWLLAGTGLQAGQSLPGLVGSEYDRYFPDLPGPRNIEIVAHSRVTCRGHSDYSDLTYYSAPSQAGVFASGTNYWVAAIGDKCPSGTDLCPATVVNQVTENLLAVFGVGPAGGTHPSQANWRTIIGSGPTRPVGEA